MDDRRITADERDVAIRRAGFEGALAKRETGAQLRGKRLDDEPDLAPERNQPGGVGDEGEGVRLGLSSPPIAAQAKRHLSHEEPSQHEEGRREDVPSGMDGEPPIGRGVQQVEAQARSHGADGNRLPTPEEPDTGHYDDQHQGHICVRQVGPKWQPRHRHHDRNQAGEQPQ